MVQYLEVPDFHFSPKWADTSLQCAKSIALAAERNNVDFIAIAGDFFDAPIMATDKGGLRVARGIMRMLLSVCPVVAIQGTPSHDGPGCYGIFEDMGLTVLQPGMVYGLEGGAIVQDPPYAASCILFGIPELNKQTIQADLHLSAEHANAEAVNLLAEYILEFVAPMRSKFPLLPAFGLLHGNVSDSHHDNETDIILRASDIVIHTEDLMPANLNRWTLGHIHTPWESMLINAGYSGYPGIDSNPWGKRDFVPAMNLVAGDSVTRIPYGTPERRKITQPLASYDSSVAYWLVSSDPNATAPDAHPWSRVTYDEKRTETRRVTAEQAAEVKTLRDLYKLIDPTVHEDTLALVDTIPPSASASHRRVSLAMRYLCVKGCTFFGGRTVEFDLASLPVGVTAIRGDNGSGKSSLLSFCSPYPLVIGKDTSSGRISAIKEFFSGRESSIEKRFLVNGDEHRHLITIKGAHTQSAKTECYLYINGASQLDCGTFDEMLAVCERLYGPYADYLLTTFYVQPLQGKAGSSLMSASMTDIRNLVQSIAGIDRESEKRFALDALAKADKQSDAIRSWIAGAQQFATDSSALEGRLASLKASIPALDKALALAKERGITAAELHDQLRTLKSATDSERVRKQTDESAVMRLRSTRSARMAHVEKLLALVDNLPALKARIEAHHAAVAHNRTVDDMVHSATQAKREYDTAVYRINERIASLESDHRTSCRTITEANETAMVAYQRKSNTLAASIESLRTRREDMLARITALNLPCPQCGYLDDEAKSKIARLKEEQGKLTEAMDKAHEDLKALTQPLAKPLPEPPSEIAALRQDVLTLVPPKAPEISKRMPMLDPTGLAATQNLIAEAESAASEIASHRANVEAIDSQLADYSARTYAIDERIAEQVRQADADLERKRAEYASMKTERDLALHDISLTEIALEAARKRESDIAIERERLVATERLSVQWRYIASMLQSNKIPALELELMLDSIDAEATRIIEPYQEGRFAFETRTQDDGVDRFDILVYDATLGCSRSFLKHSPGQKAFFADAYVKALVRQRNERAERSYTPVIMDESDGPIQPELVAAYYEMQRRYWTDCPVLAVSHSPASHEHITSQIEIERLKGLA